MSQFSPMALRAVYRGVALRTSHASWLTCAEGNLQTQHAQEGFRACNWGTKGALELTMPNSARNQMTRPLQRMESDCQNSKKGSLVLKTHTKVLSSIWSVQRIMRCHGRRMSVSRVCERVTTMVHLRVCRSATEWAKAGGVRARYIGQPEYNGQLSLVLRTGFVTHKSLSQSCCRAARRPRAATAFPRVRLSDQICE